MKAKKPPPPLAAAPVVTEEGKGALASAIALIASALGVGGAAVDAPDAKVKTRTETTKHVVREESDDDMEEAEGDDDAAEEAESRDEEDPESSTSDSEPPAEEEGKVIAKAYAAADKAYAAAVGGDPGLLLRRPSALATEAAKATGQRSVSATMGALSGFRATIKAQDRTAARVDRIEREQRETKVNARLVAAIKSGKITRAEVMSLKAQGMKDPAWLKGHLAILPKRLRTTDDDPIEPREGTDGAGPIAGMGTEQAKIIEGMCAGMNPEQKAAFMASFNQRLTEADTARAQRRPRS